MIHPSKHHRKDVVKTSTHEKVSVCVCVSDFEISMVAIDNPKPHKPYLNIIRSGISQAPTQNAQMLVITFKMQCCADFRFFTSEPAVRVIIQGSNLLVQVSVEYISYKTSFMGSNTQPWEYN